MTRVPADSTGPGLLAGARAMIVVAAVSNISHTYDHAHRHGQDQVRAAVVALIPDALLVLSMLRLRRDAWSVWAWMGVVASTAFVSWAALATAPADSTARIIALAPVGGAVIATGLAGHATRHATATSASDVHVPSRVHVEAAVRVGVDRGHVAGHASTTVEPRVESTPVDVEVVAEPVAGHVDPVDRAPRAAVESTPTPADSVVATSTDPREAAYVAWLGHRDTWTRRDVADLLGIEPKAATEQIRRWKRRTERGQHAAGVTAR